MTLIHFVMSNKKHYLILSEKHIPSCKFEYTIRYWTGGFLSTPRFEIQEKFLNTVNEWGQEGWEVVQVFTTVEEKSILGIFEKAGILLKRKIDETSIV